MSTQLIALTVDLNGPPSASPVLALVATVHLGLAALRNHRSAATPVSSLALVSLLMAALPWTFPSLAGLAFGVVVHVAWFAVCERFAPSKPTHPRAGPVGLGATPKNVPASRPAVPAAQKHFTPTPVLAVVDETPTIKTIRLARPEGLEFEAGQFLTVRIRVDGQEHARCYSVSSAPEARGYLEISVRKQGLVSNALHSMLRPGATLAIKGPLGAFKFPATDDRPLVLIAGGIGITPLVSMLRHVVAAEPTRPVTLLYSARSEADFAFRDELECLHRRHPQVRVYLAVSSGAAAPHIYAGHIDEALLRMAVPALTDSVCLVCGPGPMIETMRALLASIGVPPGQIRHEAFNAAIAASAEAPSRPEPTRQTGRGAAYQMECARTGKRVRIAAGQTLLEAAEDAAVALPSMCRAGVCGTCRVHVTEGDVECASDTLDPGDQDQGFVLACVTTTRSDCAVDV